MTPTREEAFTAIRNLNTKIAGINAGALINGAKYGHEIDNGYGKIETVGDAIKPLAKMVHWLRHEAGMVNIPDGSYAWAIKLCEQAEMLVGQIENIERRAT